ncbi:MAG: hypothetical protein AAGJ10_01430 [Bacteroidota bacterium]
MLSRILFLGLTLTFFACQKPASDSSTADAATSETPQLTGTYAFEAGARSGELKVVQDDTSIQFDLLVVGPPPAYNQGYMGGEATLGSDTMTATYSISEFGGVCELSFSFDAETATIETLQGDSPTCGFGRGVMADGTYTRTSTDTPTIEEL